MDIILLLSKFEIMNLFIFLAEMLSLCLLLSSLRIHHSALPSLYGCYCRLTTTMRDISQLFHRIVEIDGYNIIIEQNRN